MKKYILCTLVVSIITGCTNQPNVSPFPSVSDRAKHSLNRPVNCSTAKTDISILEDERASTAKQILSGVRSVFPVAAAAGILTGDYNDRFEVATGEYNYVLEQKIQKIKSTCHVG